MYVSSISNMNLLVKTMRYVTTFNMVLVQSALLQTQAGRSPCPDNNAVAVSLTEREMRQNSRTRDPSRCELCRNPEQGCGFSILPTTNQAGYRTVLQANLVDGRASRA
jgi:hypothetical protein